MSASRHPALSLWLGWARWLKLWHRYEVQGIEVLDEPGSKLILGYHGRAFAHDLIALNWELYRRQGRIPVSIIHSFADDFGPLRWMKEGMEAVTGDEASVQKVVQEGRHIVLLPGGNREANRSFRVRYQVDWGARLGYLKFALRHRLPIVPVASSGVDDAYIGLNDGYSLGKRLKLPSNLPAWVGIGPLGLMPFSPTFPVKFRQLVGQPIDLYADGTPDPRDTDHLYRLHARVTGAVQDLLNQAREKR